MTRAREAWLAAALIAIFVAIPVFTSSEYYFTILIVALIFAVLSTAMNVVFGYAGLLSLAQVAFFGLGGYTAAILATRLGVSMWPGLLAGGAVALAAGLAVAYAALRLSRHAFVILSLSFALLCAIVARDWIALTRGSLGISGLPAPEMTLPGLGRIVFDRSSRLYLVVLPFAILVLGALYALLTSRIGRCLIAIKHNEPLAQSQGISPLRYKLIAIGVSAFATGMAGALFVFYLTLVDPSIFDFYYTEAMLIMVITGGPGSFWGVLGATAVFSIVPELLRLSSEWRLVIYGALLVAAAMLFPTGFAGYLRRRRLARWVGRS